MQKTEIIGGTPKVFNYEYDTLGRLEDVFIDGILDEHFGYDTNGNRTTHYSAATGLTVTPTYDDQDRLLTYGTWTFAYAANGELETKTNTATSDEWIFGCDALGNLLSVGLPNGDLVEYLVDGAGRRVAKKLNGVVTKQWIYRDALKPVAELDGSGALVAQFVYGSKSNVPDYVRRGGATYRVVSDHLGSPRYVVNVANAGDVPFTANYSAFGSVTGTGLDWMPFGFAGGIYDSDTGLVRFGARDYDPSVGRWTAKDPLRFDADGTGFYVYGLGDPVNRRDPTGLFSGCEEGLAARIAAGALVGGAVGGPWGALVGAAIAAGLVPSDTPANDNAGDRPPVDAAGSSSKGPPGPKSRGICDLTFDLIEAGSGSHTCHYYCAQDGSRPKFSMPNSLPCPERVAWGTGR